MAIVACAKCGAKNRVDEQAALASTPVCGKCGTALDFKAGSGNSDTSKPRIVTDATFAKEVLASDLPVLLDCWAVWCGPCRIIAPVLDQLAAESNGRYIIAKLDVDENPQTAAQFGVRSIPTLLIFKHGKLLDTLIGAQPKQVIAARLERAVAAAA
jgi:thioredoxin